MRRTLAAMSVFVLFLSSAGCAQDAAAPPAAADRFKSTVLTANLEEPLVDGKNVVWCAAFQRADAPAFEKRIEFAVPFEPSDNRYEFATVPVKGFGFTVRSPNRAELLKQVILYGGARDPIVELKTTVPDDRLILAVIEPRETLAETVAAVMEQLKDNEPVDLDKQGIGEVVLPMFDLDIARAARRVVFQLGKQSDRPVAEEAMRWYADYDVAFFSDPFLVVLLRKGEEKPYFAMWVADPEALLRSPTHFPYAEIGRFSDGLARVSSVMTRGYFGTCVGKCGYIDRTGRLVIPLTFADAGAFDGGVAPAAVIREDAAKDPDANTGPGLDPNVVVWGLIGKDGKWVMKPQFGRLRDFHEGLAAATKAPPLRKADEEKAAEDETDEAWGFIDRKGEWVVPPQYKEAEDFSGGVALVETAGGKKGYVDRAGRLLGGTVFDEVRPFAGGAAAVCANKGWGFINPRGGFIAKPRFFVVGDFGVEGVAAVMVMEGAKWGLLNIKGEFVVEPQFDDISEFHGGLAGVALNGKYGFIDASGKLAVKPEYDSAFDFDDGVALVSKGDAQQLIDATGRVVGVIPRGYDIYQTFAHGLAMFKTDDKLAVIDRTGRILVELEGGDLNHVDEETGAMSLTGRAQSGFIDPNGTWVIDRQFGIARDFSEGLAAVEVKGKWGYIDRGGRVVIQPQFKRAKDFSEGLAAVAVVEGEDCLWGFINKTGRVVIPPRYADTGDFSEGLAAVELKEKQPAGWAYVDKTGLVVIEPQFTFAERFRDGKARVGSEKGSLVDRSGKAMDDPIPSEGRPLVDGRVAVYATNWMWGFADAQGRVAIEPLYKEVGDFAEKAAPVKVWDRWGFIDPEGRVLVKPQYGAAWSFCEGLAAAQLDGNWGFLDREFKWAVKPEFDSVRSFREGRAAVSRDGRWFHIDKTGRAISAEEFGNVGDFHEGLAVADPVRPGVVVLPGGKAVPVDGLEELEGVSEGLAWIRTAAGIGCMDMTGEWVLPPRFEDARGFSNGLAAVRIKGKWGYIDRAGRMVIAPRFAFAGMFVDGIAGVGIGGGVYDADSDRWGLIDRTGKFLTTAGGD